MLSMPSAKYYRRFVYFQVMDKWHGHPSGANGPWIVAPTELDLMQQIDKIELAKQRAISRRDEKEEEADVKPEPKRKPKHKRKAA